MLVEADGAPGGWELHRVEAGRSGGHRLRRAPSPDERRIGSLRDAELLAQSARGRGGDRLPYEVARSLPADPRRAQMELASLDAAFDQVVLEAAVRDLVDRWASASEGRPQLLAEVAMPGAVRQLLRREVAMRGAEVRDVAVRQVLAMRLPAEIVLQLRINAWRGPRERTEGVREGLDMTRDHVWRLARHHEAGRRRGLRPVLAGRHGA